MPVLFWSLSTDPEKQAASQAALMQAYGNLTGGKRLVKPDEPKQEPIEIPVDTDMELEETARFMQQAPSRRRDGVA